MVGLGLRVPTSVASDGAPGLINAIEQVFPKSLRVRCRYHTLSNIRAKLPPEAADEVLAHARAVRDAATHEAGEAQAAKLIARFGEAAYPAAVKSFTEDLEASLAHLTPPRPAAPGRDLGHLGGSMFSEVKTTYKQLRLFKWTY